MNPDLLTAIKLIIAKESDSILSEPRRVTAFLSDLAKDVPKAQKTALIKCLEYGYAKLLKDIPETERANAIQKMAQRLHDEEGLDLVLCGETFELLAKVLFGTEFTAPLVPSANVSHKGTAPPVMLPVIKAGPDEADNKFFNVILTDYDKSKKTAVMAKVRPIMNLFFSEVKGAAQSPPLYITKGVSREIAELIKSVIGSVGGMVEIEEV